MATTITINTPETIEFRATYSGSDKAHSFVVAQLGEWELDSQVETGIVIDSSDLDVFPAVLSANNARKLAKWLMRAAEQLDTPSSGKSAKRRQHYEQDDDDDYGLRLNK